MSISFSGLASGLDTSSWVEALVSVKQQKISSMQLDLQAVKTKKSTLNATRSSVTALRTAIEKLTDKKFGGTYDLFGRNAAVSSNEDVFTATASNTAIKQTYNISVQKLATMTKATSLNSASSIADDSTKLSGLGITAGNLTVFVDGLKNTITIGEEDTLGDLKTSLAAIGVNAAIDENGIMSLTPNGEQNIHVGATNDSTNFMSVTGMASQGDGTYSSSVALYKANAGTVLTSENSGFNTQITAGTFTIGNAEFTIGANTTLSDIIAQINNNEDAQVSAYWDDTTGKITLTSTKEGSSYINIEAGTSNFTDVMGFTETTRDGEGNILSSIMYVDAQTLGENAQFTINGTMMTSTSNTITSDVSRLAGVTLTLKKVSTEEDGDTTLRIEQDSAPLVEAVKNFVDAYNETMSKIEEVTAKGADLQRETSLTSLRSTLRNYANGRNSSVDGAYHLLSQLGISTMQANSDNLSTDTTKLQFDEEAFKQALEEDPDSLEALIGTENGILGQMESALETSLKAVSGFFDVKQSTYDSEIRKSEEKVKKQQEKISTYKAQLEKRFSAMETLISKMQQNYSSFLS